MAKRKNGNFQFLIVQDGECSVAIIATRAGWVIDRIQAPTLEEAERLAQQRVRELEDSINKKRKEE
jgi:aspartyl/asparaginyl-tRNA synthetase